MHRKCSDNVQLINVTGKQVFFVGNCQL